MIEVRISRVAIGVRHWQLFVVKGEAAEGFRQPGGGILGRRRICGGLSRLWSAINEMGYIMPWARAFAHGFLY